MKRNRVDGHKPTLLHELTGADGWGIRLSTAMEHLSEEELRLLRVELGNLWTIVGVEMVRRGQVTEE